MLSKPENSASELADVIHGNEATLGRLKAELASVQARLASLGSDSGVSPAIDHDKLIGSVRSYVIENLANELAVKFEKEVRDAAHLSFARITFQDTAARLRSEIGSLTRRGNLNLVIGVVTTGFAVWLLVYMVLGANTSFETWPTLLSHYVPRITTVVFIEVFAFFFLRLYKNSLAEIKYYQNELTTLAAHHIAFETAHGVEGDKAKLILVAELVKANNNHDSAVTTEGKPSTAGDLKELSEILDRVTKLVVSSAKREKANDG